MKEIPQHVSESFRKLNPHIYGLGGLETKKPEPVAAPPLEGKPLKHKCRKGVVVVCSLVVFSKRELDDDNIQGSCKPLRDVIAESVGIDDGDRCWRWQYSQVRTAGREGVQVIIERL